MTESTNSVIIFCRLQFINQFFIICLCRWSPSVIQDVLLSLTDLSQNTSAYFSKELLMKISIRRKLNSNFQISIQIAILKVTSNLIQFHRNYLNATQNYYKSQNPASFQRFVFQMIQYLSNLSKNQPSTHHIASYCSPILQLDNYGLPLHLKSLSCICDKVVKLYLY